MLCASVCHRGVFTVVRSPCAVDRISRLNWLFVRRCTSTNPAPGNCQSQDEGLGVRTFDFSGDGVGDLLEKSWGKALAARRLADRWYRYMLGGPEQHPLF